MFSPTGLLVSGSGGCNTIRVWDPLLGWECTCVLSGHTGWVRHLAFALHRRAHGSRRGSSDGSMFAGNAGASLISASNDSTLRVWDFAAATETGAKPTVVVLKGHTAAVLSCCIVNEAGSRGAAPASTATKVLVLSGSADQTHRVWDAATGVFSPANEERLLRISTTLWSRILP